MAIDEQRLKDLLRNIETGDLPEDIPDSEDYDDMGGIKSLDKGAPSIKLASETRAEELDLEGMSLIREFEDLKEKGVISPDTSFDDFMDMYLSRKKMMEDKRAMAAYGGRMKYGDGTPDIMGNPAVVTKIDNMREEQIMNPNVEDVADYKTYYKKLKARDEEIKRMLDKAKKEKVKRAKGGIAGVL